jgi:hypothetical protein
VTEPWTPATAEGQAPPSWRDPAAWRDDPAATAQAAKADLQVLTAERPETLVGAAFAGGVLSALILRHLAR